MLALFVCGCASQEFVILARIKCEGTRRRNTRRVVVYLVGWRARCRAASAGCASSSAAIAAAAATAAATAAAAAASAASATTTASVSAAQTWGG